MRSKKFPSWLEWQKVIVEHVKNAVSATGLKGYGLAGNSENLYVGVDTPDLDAKSMPFVRVGFGGVMPGWDGSSSDYKGRHHTELGGGKVMEQRKDVEERIAFDIEILGQRQEQLLPILQAIRDYFGFQSTISLTLHGNTHICHSELSNLISEPNEDVSGKITFTRFGCVLVLDITSEVFLESSLSSGAVIPDIDDISVQLDARLSATGTASTIIKTI